MNILRRLILTLLFVAGAAPAFAADNTYTASPTLRAEKLQALFARPVNQADRAVGRFGPDDISVAAQPDSGGDLAEWSVHLPTSCCSR